MSRYTDYLRSKIEPLRVTLPKCQRAISEAAAVHGPIVREIFKLVTARKAKTRKAMIETLAPKFGMPKSRVQALISDIAWACHGVTEGVIHLRQHESAAHSLRARRTFPVSGAAWGTHKPVLLWGTPEQRLERRRAATVERLFRSLYRTSRNDSEVRVRVGLQAAAAYEEAACYPYRGSYKTYSAIASIHTVTVGRRWITRVHKAGLEIVDGHLILDAERFWTPASQAGVTMFDVAYLVQGRGFTVRLERGVVAVDGNKRVLAPNIQQAVRAIDRKLAA
jgi:hypothetical protein